MLLSRPFDIGCLDSEELMRIFNETSMYKQGVRIEVVAKRKSRWNCEEHPATTIGLPLQRPTIRFINSLDKGQRIEAIGHELLHLLLFYRYGLGVIGLKTPYHGDREELFKFCMNLNKHWGYLLGQIVNTVHHLILIDYLKEEYGIRSDLHNQLLQHNFHIIANDHSNDRESLYAKGLIAFEYEKCIGRIDQATTLYPQTEFFWNAYHSARDHFEGYHFPSIPGPSSYENDILSFLEALGYQKEDFIFFSETDLRRNEEDLTID